MKVKCGQLAKEKLSVITPIFKKDFYDRILRRSHKLDIICEYIRQNPYRLLVRQFNPDFFRRINNIKIQGALWQAYGNLHSENGGVLVSPFISPAEKDVRRQCENANGKIILLSNKPFSAREKPASHDFGLCSEGRLLFLAPINPLPAGRNTFLYLNSVAESISLINPKLLIRPDS